MVYIYSRPTGKAGHSGYADKNFQKSIKGPSRKVIAHTM